MALRSYSTAIGSYAKAWGKNGTTAIGALATTDELGTAVGYKAQSSAWGGVALGNHSKADVKEGIAGYDLRDILNKQKNSPAWKSTRGAVSIGDISQRITRQIVGVAAGFKDTDAVNIAQLKALKKWVEKEGATWQLSVNGQNIIKVTPKSKIDLAGSDNLKVIKKDKSNQVMFDLAKDLKVSSVTLGDIRVSDNGINAGNRNITNVAEGKLSVDSTDVVSGAQLYKIGDSISQYLGGNTIFRNGNLLKPWYILSRISTDGTVKQANFNDVGSAFRELDVNIKNVNSHLKYVSDNFGEAIGKIFEDLQHNTVSWSKRDKAFAALHTKGGKRKNSKLRFLADGDIAPNSTDAITGKQLWKTNERVNSLKGKVDNVIDQVNTLTEEVVTYDKDEYGKKSNSITLTGTDDGTPIIIDNVADGRVEKGSRQAVNGGQLKEQISLVLSDANKYTDEKIENMVGDAIAQTNKYTNMKFETLNSEIENTKKEARQAAAIGLAVASLHYINTPGVLSIAFGSGVWRGQSALAFGTGYMSEDGTVRSNLSVTTSGGHWGVGAGVSWSLK